MREQAIKSPIEFNCGAAKLKQDYRTYRCENCRYRLFKNLAGRELSPEEVTTLIQERKVGPLEGFRRKTGGPFLAFFLGAVAGAAAFWAELSIITWDVR